MPLTVYARDSYGAVTSPVTTINVNVTDINDNEPIFSPASYHATVNGRLCILKKILCHDSECQFNIIIGLYLTEVLHRRQGY